MWVTGVQTCALPICSKQTPATLDDKQTATHVSDGDELTNAREEIKKMLAAVRRIEEAEKEKEFIVAVAKGAGRRRTVDGQVHKAAPVTVITSANMWALLSDDDSGRGSTSISMGNNQKYTKADVAVADIVEKEEAPLDDNVRAQVQVAPSRQNVVRIQR